MSSQWADETLEDLGAAVAAYFTDVQDADANRERSPSFPPSVAVTGIHVTRMRDTATIHIRYADGELPSERLGAHLRVPAHLDEEARNLSSLQMVAEHVFSAFSELTWAGGDPLSWPMDQDGVRWFTGDVV